MTSGDQDRIDKLSEQEDRLVFDAFDHGDAWRLGTHLVERAARAGQAVIIEIRRPGLVLFRSAAAGTTAENEAWLERKARTVFRYECSTALLAARMAAQGVDVWTAPWFDHQTFTPAGGSFPVRVRGVGVVAAVTVSGLTSEEDHDLAVAALEAYLGAEPAGRPSTATGTATAIQHTVAFSLRHPTGSDAEADFLRAALELATIPGVERFEQRRQVSAKSDFEFSFAMIFADDAAYQAYNVHPVHVAFVRDRWEVEVTDFQELDFVALPGEPVQSRG